MLWIALKFFVLLQSKQRKVSVNSTRTCCELLSNFLYFCSRNNAVRVGKISLQLWIALKFFVLLQSKQLCYSPITTKLSCELLSNFLYFCSRNNWTKFRKEFGTLWIALKFFVLLQSKQHRLERPCLLRRCELLSNFLYFCSRNNENLSLCGIFLVVNCSQIFCTFAVETTTSSENSPNW